MPILRDFFIGLSHNKTLERFLTNNRFGRKISRRFVAGETLQDLKFSVEKLLNEGFLLTVAYLGEHFHNVEMAKKHTEEYLKLADVLKDFPDRAEISLKPSQLGLEISRDLFYDNLKTICQKANPLNIYINVDVEEYRTLHDTVDVVLRLNSEGFKVGTVIQAYLFESEKILMELAKYSMNIRLVKGAYKESPEVAYQKKKDINENFKKLSVKMLEMVDKIYPEFATHDDKIINFIIERVKEMGISGDRFEFQMLYGVRPKLQREILNKGYRMRVYLPYGEYWYPYFMRRLAEKPSNAILVLRGMFG